MNSKCIFDCTMRHFSSDIYKILEVLMVLSSQNNVRNVSNFPPNTCFDPTLLCLFVKLPNAHAD